MNELSHKGKSTGRLYWGVKYLITYTCAVIVSLSFGHYRFANVGDALGNFIFSFIVLPAGGGVLLLIKCVEELPESLGVIVIPTATSYLLFVGISILGIVKKSHILYVAFIVLLLIDISGCAMSVKKDFFNLHQ